MSIDVGTKLGGRYVLTHQIASGGMGSVWAAKDEVLDRTVAMKVIRQDLADDKDFAARFNHEARLAARLSHGNIAQVHDFGQDGGIDYLVMEYVRGRSLASMIDDGPIPAPQVVNLIGQAASALAYAHENGVIHRDVKPANILVTDRGEVKLTDFGIARALGEAKMTRTGEVMGTVQYLAPEAALGRDLSGQADVYSLAVVAYECLAGARPFYADSAVSLAMKHVNDQPPPLPGNIPQPIQSAVLRGLAKDPNRRQQGANAFAGELRRAMSGAPAPIEVAATRPAPRPTRPMPSHTPPPQQYYQPPQDFRPAPPAPQYMQATSMPYAVLPRSKRPATRGAKVRGWAWMVLALISALSTTMTWATWYGKTFTAFQLSEAEQTYSSKTSTATSASVVMLVLILGLAALAIPQALGKGHTAWGIIGFFVGFLSGVIWLACLGAILGSSDSSTQSQLSLGIGVWVCVIPGLAAGVLALTSAFKPR